MKKWSLILLLIAPALLLLPWSTLVAQDMGEEETAEDNGGLESNEEAAAVLAEIKERKQKAVSDNDKAKRKAALERIRDELVVFVEKYSQTLEGLEGHAEHLSLCYYTESTDAGLKIAERAIKDYPSGSQHYDTLVYYTASIYEAAAKYDKAIDYYTILKDTSNESRFTKMATLKIKILASKAIRLGADAPELAFTDLNGNEFKLSNQTGKAIFVNFWATW